MQFCLPQGLAAHFRPVGCDIEDIALRHRSASNGSNQHMRNRKLDKNTKRLANLSHEQSVLIACQNGVSFGS
jgi:hypothetical protein